MTDPGLRRMTMGPIERFPGPAKGTTPIALGWRPEWHANPPESQPGTSAGKRRAQEPPESPGSGDPEKPTGKGVRRGFFG